MNPMQGCLDCNNFTYGFDIELVDELGQSISDIDYEISLGGNNKILKKGKTDGEGRIQVDGLPSKPLFLTLDTATLLKEMQASRRHLRLGRTEADSTVKPRAEQQGREYSYATVGQLINALPVIPDWPEKRALPHFHFPDKEPQGWLILPRGNGHVRVSNQQGISS